MHSILNRKLLTLKLEDIKASLTSPRKDFDDCELKALADSIAANGILEPLIVRKSFDGKYEIIAGYRRFEAAKKVGLRRLPCLLLTVDDATAAVFGVSENLQRKDLNLLEEAEAIQRLMRFYGLTALQAAVKLGITQTALYERLAILKLSKPLREKIASHQLDVDYVKMLLSIPHSKREAVLDAVVKKGLTALQGYSLAESLLNPTVKPPDEEKPVRKYAIGDQRLFYNSLAKLVETLQSAGVMAKMQKCETAKYTEYKVRINKEQPESNKCKQLKIC